MQNKEMIFKNNI